MKSRRGRILISRVLNLLAVAIGLGWFASVMYFLMQNPLPDSDIAYWYAVIALSNNFAFFFLVGLPVMMLLLPFGLLMEWLGNRADEIKEAVRDEEREEARQVELAKLPPAVKRTPEELEQFRLDMNRRADESARYIADYFASRPAKPKPTRAPKRRKRRY